MRDTNIAIFGIYPSRADALEAVETLKTAGFRNTDVAVLLPDNPGTKDFAVEMNTKAPEGATSGGIIGAVIGGILAWLTAMSMITVPGLDPLVAAGPIIAALAGIGAGGVVGGLIGALIGLGMPEYQAKRFEGRIRKGGILLSVHCDRHEWTKRAKSILKETGARNISSAKEAKADFAASDRPMRRAVPSDARETDPAYPARTPASTPIRPEDDEIVHREPEIRTHS